MLQFSRFCTVLLNDENHSFPEVIAILKKSLNCQQKLATDLTEFVDSEGRAVIKVGSYSVSLDAHLNGSIHFGRIYLTPKMQFLYAEKLYVEM